MVNEPKRGPGRPPKSEAPYESERRDNTLAFWRGLSAAMNERHARGYRLDRLFDMGGNDLLLVWKKCDTGKREPPTGPA